MMKLAKLVAEWIRSRSGIEAVLWFFGAVACLSILAWFFLFSGYGEPPEFVYEQF